MPGPVLIAQLWHEAHSRNAMPTMAGEFTVEVGDDVLALNREADSALAGMLAVCGERGLPVVPVLAARGRPGGPVPDDLYLRWRSRLIDAVSEGGCAAVLLDLHGAMVTDSLDDVEGDLLQALRRVVGPDVPIAAAVDLHGHVTGAMLEAADICFAYKTNPHRDMAETGRAVADALADMLQGRLRPARTLVRLPLLVPGFCETDDAPLSLLHDIRRRLTEANSTVSDISVCTPNAFLDVPGLGVTVLATTNGEAAQAEELALGLADAIWCMRDAFDYPREPLASVFDRIAASGKRALFAVADLGDVVLAGAPGDSVTILDHVANRHPGLKGAIPVFDAEAVAIARTQGIGTTVDLMVGAKHTPGQRPFHLVGKVRSLGDGRFTARGKYMRKVAMDLGPTAVVRSGNLDVLLTGRPGFTQDPEAFESQGIPLDGLDFVVVKSANHFKLSFSGLATPLAADTPGLTRFDPLGSGHRRSRPLHPFDPDATMAMIRYTFPPRAFESARA